MADNNNESVNSIVAQALQNAGVSEPNINLPSETEPGQDGNRPNLDGSLKGEVKGAVLEDSVESTEAKADTEEPAETKSDEPIVQPLSKADIETAISDMSSKFQSIMDRKINALTVQMQGTANALNQFFQAQEDASLSGLPAEEQTERRLKRLETGGTLPKIPVTPAQQESQGSNVTYYQGLVDTLDAVGIRIDDARIDWGKDSTNLDYATGLARFKTSVGKILAADIAKQIDGLKKNGEKEISKLRKKVGVDQTSTKGPSGAGLPDVSKMTAFEKLTYGYEQADQMAQASQ